MHAPRVSLKMIDVDEHKALDVGVREIDIDHITYV